MLIIEDIPTKYKSIPKWRDVGVGRDYLKRRFKLECVFVNPNLEMIKSLVHFYDMSISHISCLLVV